MDPFPGAVDSPVTVVIVNGGPRRKVMREIPPQAPVPNDVEDGINDAAHGNCARTATNLSRREKRLKQCPLLIGEICGVVMSCFHVSLDENPQDFRTGSKEF